MKLIQALEVLSPNDALHSLAAQAFRPVEDYSGVTSLVAGYQLWDRTAADPMPAIQALSSPDIEVANRAEWGFVKAGQSVLAILRQELPTADASTRARIIHILAWQGDSESIPLLRDLQISNPQDKALRDWALQKIALLSFNQ